MIASKSWRRMWWLRDVTNASFTATLMTLDVIIVAACGKDLAR